MKSFGLPAWGRGLRACWRGVCVCFKKKRGKKKLVLTAGVCVCMVVGFQGGGTRPALHKVQPTQTPGFRSNLTPPLPSPPSPPPSTLVLRNAGRRFFFFFSGNETLLCSEDSRRFSRPPLPRQDGGGGGRSRTSSRPAFEVWEVKITGTDSRLNRRFHLPGRIKAPAAGVCLPCSPLTSKHAVPNTHPPTSSAPRTRCTGVFLFGAIKKENTTDKLHQK